MMTYKVNYTKSALKELKKLSVDVQKRVLVALVKLAQNPRSGNVRPMVGTTAWRLRVGDYRVVYDFSDQKVTILVIRVAHRRDVYKK